MASYDETRERNQLKPRERNVMWDRTLRVDESRDIVILLLLIPNKV
jgi:hypothetical protein